MRIRRNLQKNMAVMLLLALVCFLVMPVLAQAAALHVDGQPGDKCLILPPMPPLSALAGLALAALIVAAACGGSLRGMAVCRGAHAPPRGACAV